MDKEQKNITLNGETKVGLTFGQILSLVAVVAMFVMGYADLNTRLAALEQSKVDKKEFYEIKESLIRIEGKLDLKADKNWIK